MTCLLEELCRKDVINIDSGSRVGSVYDAEVDTVTGQTVSVLIRSYDKGLGLKKPEMLKVLWHDIVVIGDETILVKNVICPPEPPEKPQKRFLEMFSR